MSTGDVFIVLDVLPVAAAGFVCTLGIIFWLVIVACLHINQLEWINKYFSIEFNVHRFMRYVFPVLKAGPNDCKLNDEMQTILLGYEVPSFFVEQLLLFSFVVIALSAQVLISSYLFIKSYGCSTEPYIHCFEAKAAFLDHNSVELDCKNSTLLEDIDSIICYDLALDIKRAILDAAAIAGLGVIYFAYITWFLLTLSNAKWWSLKRIQRLKYPAVFGAQIGTMLLALLIVHARVVALAIDRDIVFDDFIYLLIHTYAVVIGGIVPWWRFKPVEKDCATL